MAKITNLGNEVDLRWIHNVSYAVGPGCSNSSDDVMMIQHLLNKVMPSLDIVAPNGKPITAYLKRDGIFGPKTHAAIAGYQNNLRSRGKVASADGRIHPSNKSGWNAHGNQYTIVHLNRDHRNIYGRLADDAEFPPPVIAALKRNPVEG